MVFLLFGGLYVVEDALEINVFLIDIPGLYNYITKSIKYQQIVTNFGIWTVLL